MKAEKGKKQNIKTSNFDKMSSLIKDVTNQNLKSIVIPLELIEYAGEIQKAAFLARLIYLSDKGSKPNGFIWKSYPEWKKEIGLSQSQVERIVADFQGRNILEAKKMMAASKNSNASNTWHYRLLMNNFSTDFKKFLLVRAEENLGLEAEETSSSITDSTNINTFENTSLYKEQYVEKDVIEKIDLDIDSDLPYNGDYSNDLDVVSEEYPSAAPDAAFLSADFEPLLEHQIWAVNSYPYKSPKFITDKFKSYFTTGKGKDVKKSDAEWQLSWRGWITMEKSFGATQYSFDEEHLEIRNELFLDVCDFVWDYNRLLVPYKEIIKEFCKIRNFDESTIKEYLDMNISIKNLDSYFDCYFNSKEYEVNAEYAEEVDDAMCEYIWHDTSEELQQMKVYRFIQSKLLVTESDLRREFHWSIDRSISHFLRVGIKFGYLEQVGDYYHEKFRWITNAYDYGEAEISERIESIKNLLSKLGLNNYLGSDERSNIVEQESY
jgi:hypothetical protein